MKGIFWLVIFGSALAAGFTVWYSLRKWKARQADEEARAASFLAATADKTRMVESAPVQPAMPAAPAASSAHSAPSAPAAPAAGDGLMLQKLLFEAAHKAGEAGEPALAIQLYARLLARYPASTFAPQVRAAVEAQKKKLVKA